MTQSEKESYQCCGFEAYPIHNNLVYGNCASEASSVPANRILATLPEEEYQRLAPHLEQVSLSLGEVLHESGEAISHVYLNAG